MKDYSKVKYVKPSVGGTDITKGNVYYFKHPAGAGGFIKNDKGCKILVYIPSCAHLDNKKWIPCDKDGNEIEI